VRSYSQAELESLVTYPKVITDAPRKEMRSEQGSKKNDMWLRSADGEHEFTVFMRVSEAFPEDFSIGLVYLPKDEPGSIILLRCNGPHGELEGTFDISHPHFRCHVHRAKAENIAAGSRPEKGGEPTDSFASFEQALPFFLKLINLSEAGAVMPRQQQLGLEFDSKE